MRVQPPQLPRGEPARSGRGRAPVAAPVAVRLAAASALALFGAAHWAALVRPGAGWFAVGAVAVAGGAALAGLLVPRPGGKIPPRAVRAAIALAAALLLGLLAGVPATALAPTGWGTLVSAVADALGTLPGLRVPYAGGDPWVRAVILAGAGGLIAVGLLGAAWRRRRSRALAAAALSVLYLVPAVQLSVGAPFLRGGAFLLLLVGLLYGERVAARPRDVAPAIVLATAVALLAVLVAPVLDADEPWLNYRALASDLADEGGARSFSWDHGYGRLDWPRDGRVVLRVRARTSAYWKAANLDGFDGRRWVQAGLFADAKPRSQLPGVGESRARWSESVRVTVGDLRTSQVVGAGTTLALTSLRLRPIAVGSPGSFAVTGELHGGDSYVARVYVPRPRPAELSGASLSYPPFTAAHRIVRMPRIDRRGRRLPGSGDARAAGSRIVVPAWNSPRPLRALTPLGRVIDGDAIIRNSPYRRTWALAERLRRGSRTPYEYVRRVEEHLARGYSYSERPTPGALPLETFLFDDRRGYCQQFSGAMALLLRMGGVPARVAAGFSPGSLDRERGEYVVRDVDAHSWVEAWFPGAGWVTFDPTPSAAPARAQGLGDVAASPARAQSDGAVGDRVSDRLAPGDQDGAPGWLLPALAAALLVAVAAGAVALLVRARRHGPAPVDPQLAELVRALDRSRAAPRPGTTLQALERRFAAAPAAAGYVRAVRDARYGAGRGGPSPDQRRALRRELARAGGRLGRLRALWALPPRRPGGA